MALCDPPATLRLHHADATVAWRRNWALVVMCVLPVGLDLRQLRRDARHGQISIEQLLDIIDKQQQTSYGSLARFGVTLSDGFYRGFIEPIKVDKVVQAS